VVPPSHQWPSQPQAGLEAREATKHNRLRITVSVTFTPKGGKPQELTKAISFAKAPACKRP